MTTLTENDLQILVNTRDILIEIIKRNLPTTYGRLTGPSVSIEELAETVNELCKDMESESGL